MIRQRGGLPLDTGPYSTDAGAGNADLAAGVLVPSRDFSRNLRLMPSQAINLEEKKQVAETEGV